MTSLSGLCSSSPSLKPKHDRVVIPLFRKYSLAFPTRSNSCSKLSVAGEVSADLSKTYSVGVLKDKQGGLEKDPKALWRRYVDWLYQHKELGLYLDVSRIGFSDEFVAEMEPRFQVAFKAMEDLEKGAIANPDEGRMVGHYWLRNAKLAPKPFLQVQIEKTLDAVCKFADDVISGKVSLAVPFSLAVTSKFTINVEAGLVYLSICLIPLELQIKPPSSPEGRFTQILSVGIGGSALGPQFVAEALAPDNPPLKVFDQNFSFSLKFAPDKEQFDQKLW